MSHLVGYRYRYIIALSYEFGACVTTNDLKQSLVQFSVEVAHVMMYLVSRVIVH